MITEGLLYRKVLLKRHDQPIAQFVLPEPFRCKAVLACHDDFGHMGMERSLALLQERLFLPKMATDVKAHIRTCERCTCFKLPQERVEMKTITVSYPLKLIHRDFLTTGTRNDGNKNVSVLIVMDHFTRYVVVYVTPKQTAPIVAKVLWENFLVNIGWTEKILTDQGKNFESSLVRELCELAGVKKLRTTPYHPETNGQCECFNQMLINMVGTLPTHAKKNWQEWVSTFVSAYDSTVSSATGFTPYFLMCGHHPQLPIDIEFGVAKMGISRPTQEKHVKKLKARLKWAYKVAKETSSKESEMIL